MLRIDLLTPLYPVDPGISLGEFERLIMSEDHEIAGVFGVDGRLVLAPKRGILDAVEFIEEEAPYLRDAIVTHNHPSSSVLSPQDAALAALHEVAELRAVCPDGTIYALRRLERNWPTPDRIWAAVESAWRRLPAENVVRKASRQPILMGKSRHDWMFRTQRDDLALIGAGLWRSDAWQL